MRSGSRIRAIFSGSIGNLVEWYDWYAYAAFSIYFAPVFFPQSDKTAQYLNTAAIFAVGFLMRPVGGWLFGRIADRRGRKFSMTASVVVMSVGSLVIALCPSYEKIGIAAPALLLAARLLQGLSVGGEYGTSATYLSEMATDHRRGFYSSFQYVTLIGGQLVALALQLVLQHFVLSDAQLHSYGWRIPFVIGALLALTALYLRSTMAETRSFEIDDKRSHQRAGTIAELFKHPKSILIVSGLTMGGTLAFYTFTTYMQKFLVNTVGLAKNDATLLNFSTLFIFAAIQPLLGLLSDKVGRKPLLVSFGILGTIFTYPLMAAIADTKSLWEIFTYMMLALLIASGYTSINAAVKAEMFPTRVRALGVGLCHAVVVALFGGSAEYVALQFKSCGTESYFYLYVSFCIFLSLTVYVYMKETRSKKME